MNGRREHEPSTIWRAQELYCADRLTFEAVARACGVAVSTVKRWAEKFAWQAKRAEIAQAEADIRANTVLARAKMLKALIDTSNPMAAFAVTSLEGLAMKQAEAQRRGRQAENVEPVPGSLDFADEAAVAEALRQAVRRKLSRQVRDGVDLAGVKEILQAMDLIKTLEPKGAEGERKKKALDPETLKAIKEQVYGLT